MLLIPDSLALNDKATQLFRSRSGALLTQLPYKVRVCLDYTLMNYPHLDYLRCLDYCHSDYFGLQGHADYPHLDYYDVWTIAVLTILDYKDKICLRPFKPLNKKIHCTVQHSLNGCSLNDRVVYLGCKF